MTKEQAQDALTGLVQKQMVILGPNVAISRARGVVGIVVGDDGRVIDIVSDPDQAVRSVVDEFVALSGEISKNIINSLLS